MSELSLVKKGGGGAKIGVSSFAALMLVSYQPSYTFTIDSKHKYIAEVINIYGGIWALISDGEIKAQTANGNIGTIALSQTNLTLSRATAVEMGAASLLTLD